MVLRLLETSVLADGKIFPEGELESRCAMDEECIQCGLCCAALTLTIPEEVPQDISAPIGVMRKGAGEICPHFSIDDQGLAICGCQPVKNHNALRECREFDGGDPNEMFAENGFSFTGSRYFSVVQAAFGFALKDPSPEKVGRLFHLCQRNVIQADFQIGRIRADDREAQILALISVILSYGKLLVEILDRIHNFTNFLTPSRIDRLNLDKGNPIHNAFLERYMRDGMPGVDK